MRLTSRQTANILVVMLKRSEQTRARISRITLRVVSGRGTLRLVFLTDVQREMTLLGWVLIDLDSGGFGAIKISALEAAKAVLAKTWLSDEERRALRRSEADHNSYRAEAEETEDEAPDEE